MNSRISVFLLSFLLLSIACAISDIPLQESATFEPNSETIPTSEAIMPLATATAIEIDNSCVAEYWRIAITSTTQKDLGDGFQLVLVPIRVENNGLLWGSLSGPHKKTTNGGIFITTQDGSVYDYIDGIIQIPSEQGSGTNQSRFESTGSVHTPLLPPGFVTVGQTLLGYPQYYYFAFKIPDSKMPDSITIGGMEANCILPHSVGENGKLAYHGKRISLPVKTYNFKSDMTEAQEYLAPNNYPSLVGSRLNLPSGVIEFTRVTRDGNMVDIIFNFTNFTSFEVGVPFDGYLMGNSRVAICQTTGACDHDSSTNPLIEPGQTALDLNWSFTIPNNEDNLMFVYVFGDVFDVNQVYKIDPE